VTTDGQAVNWVASAVRNLVRVVDLLPVVTPYLVGGTMMAVASRWQRLGDLAAGTLVVRELPPPYLARLVAADAERPAERGGRLTVRQLEQVTAADLDLVARFLRRREQLPLDRRRALAERVAAPLAARLRTPVTDAESWLEDLQAQWSARRTSL